MAKRIGFYNMGGDVYSDFGTVPAMLQVFDECLFGVICHRVRSSDFTDPADVPIFQELLQWADDRGVIVYFMFSPRFINDESIPKLDQFYNDVQGSLHPSWNGVVIVQEFAKVYTNPDGTYDHARNQQAHLNLKAWTDAHNLQFLMPEATYKERLGVDHTWLRTNGFLMHFHHNWWDPATGEPSGEEILNWIDDVYHNGLCELTTLGISRGDFTYGPGHMRTAINVFLQQTTGVHLGFVKCYAREALPPENRTFFAGVYNEYPGAFEPPGGSITKYILTIGTATGGTTNPAPNSYEYNENSVATVTAIPNAGFRFVKWIYDTLENVQNPLSITMTQDYTLVPIFEAVPQATVTGKVLDQETGNPLEGASVKADAVDSALTDSTGTFNLTLPLGSYTLSINKAGYSSETVSVNLPAEEIYTIPDVMLTPTLAIEPQKIVVPIILFMSLAYLFLKGK